MNIDDETLIRSLAALGDEPVNDPDIEQHLAKFRAAYARLANDPAEAARIDRIAAAAEVDLPTLADPHHTTPDAYHPELILKSAAATIRVLDQQEKVLAAMQAKLEAIPSEPRAASKPARSPRLTALLSGFTPTLLALMVIGSVLLGIFGSGSQFATFTTGLLTLAPTAHVLLMTTGILRLVAQARVQARQREGLPGSLAILRLLLGRPSDESRTTEVHQAVTTEAIQHIAPDQGLTVNMHGDHVELTMSPTSRSSP